MQHEALQRIGKHRAVTLCVASRGASASICGSPRYHRYGGRRPRMSAPSGAPVKNATLRQLKVFEAVARRLSFSRAAEELHLTQPAVSAQVKQLEEHAGLPLFEQLGKKIYLTPAGVEMLRYSRAIIQQFHDAEVAMAELKGIAGGRLNVAVISAGDYF